MILATRVQPLPATFRLFGFRILLGLAQGIALHASRSGPSFVTDLFHPELRAMVEACLMVVPAAVNLSVPALTPRRAGAWAFCLSVTIGFIAWYSAWRMDIPGGYAVYSAALRILPVALYFTFIAQSLLLAGVRDRAVIATYPAYFDVAWSLAAQILLGVLFTALLWGVIWLGAALFSVIGLDGLKTLIQQEWFGLPLATTAFALSIHVTDVRVQLLRTSRSLFLTLAAWLLPVLAILMLCFLAALPFTGLTLLWDTHRASGILVVAGFVLVLLINAAQGDGTEATATARPLRVIAQWSAVLLPPLAVLSAFGDITRIHQHGLTPARIYVLADLCIIAIYAAGYVLSLRRIKAGLSTLAPTNLVAAWAALGLILLLWTPVADPVRLSVADQMARLRDGRVPAGAFDYGFLRSSRYGYAALLRMAAGWPGPDAATVMARAKTVLSNHPGGVPPSGQTPGAAALCAQIMLFPKGAALPDSLAAQGFAAADFRTPDCLRVTGVACQAVLTDILGQGRPQILFLSLPPVLLGQKDPGGRWEILAQVNGPLYCTNVRTLLETGQFAIKPHGLPDLQVGTASITLTAPEDTTCPR